MVNLPSSLGQFWPAKTAEEQFAEAEAADRGLVRVAGRGPGRGSPSGAIRRIDFFVASVAFVIVSACDGRVDVVLDLARAVCVAPAARREAPKNDRALPPPVLPSAHAWSASSSRARHG